MPLPITAGANLGELENEFLSGLLANIWWKSQYMFWITKRKWLSISFRHKVHFTMQVQVLTWLNPSTHSIAQVLHSAIICSWHLSGRTSHLYFFLLWDGSIKAQIQLIVLEYIHINNRGNFWWDSIQFKFLACRISGLCMCACLRVCPLLYPIIGQQSYCQIKVTLVAFFQLFVCSHMSSQIAWRYGSKFTLVAFVWFFTRVSFQVSS